MNYHFVSSVNEGVDYIEFVPLFIETLYKMFPDKCSITIYYCGDEIPDRLLDFPEVKLWKAEGQNTRFLSQWVRMLMCPLIGDDNDINIVCDIDLLPMRDFIKDVIEGISPEVIRDRIMNFGKLSVKEVQELKEVAMCWTFGTRECWKKCLGVSSIEEAKLILKEQYTPNDSPWGYDWTSDQKYLYKHIGKYGIIIPRAEFFDRMDREQPLGEVEKGIIRKHGMVDYHMPRPYSKHKILINKVLDFAILHSTSSPLVRSSSVSELDTSNDL